MCLSQLFICVGLFAVHSCHLQDPSSDSKGLFATCFGPKGSDESMEYTMQFFPLVFRSMEEILQTAFPYQSLKILFLPNLYPAVAGRHDCMTLPPSALLPNRRAIDHGTLETKRPGQTNRHCTSTSRSPSSIADCFGIGTDVVWLSGFAKDVTGSVAIRRTRRMDRASDRCATVGHQRNAFSSIPRTQTAFRRR